jgi:two-component system cell cycle response regulator
VSDSRASWLAVAAAGCVVVHGVHAATGWGGGVADALIVDGLYCAAFALVAASCALRARRDPPNRMAWTIAAVGAGAWGAAEVVYRVVTPDPGTAYPTATRALLAVGFCLAAVALLLLARHRVRVIHGTLLLDGLIGGLAVAAVAGALLFPAGDAGAGAQPGPPAMFLLADLAILAFVVTTLGLTGWRPGRCWGLMAAGIVVNTAGNAALVAQTSAGDFHRGGLVDTLFLTSALLLGAATAYPLSERAARPQDTRTLLLPAALAAVALAVLVTGALVSISPVAVALAAATGVLVVWRTSLAFAENRRLLDSSRREAVTDALTGLRNRRALVSDLADAASRAAQDAPVTLALFDLDGFKLYNDTFGHPAGDALLAGLGERLAAVAGPARAYRAGGDEFCVLLEEDRFRAADTLRDASRALAARGEGFEVSASSGVAVLPEDVRDPEAALQLADRRMYAAKERTRTSARQQARAVLFQALSEREPGLREHHEEVGRLAAAVGRRLGVEGAAVDVLTRAAELHDVGKIAIPEGILAKAGVLDPEELSFVRQHTIIGERILRAAPAMAPVARLVRSSHERWDGSGYPDGLTGEEIPLGARIIAVCDAYSAMVARRPYRLPRTGPQAVEELERGAGAQFDPRVVVAFAQVWAQLDPAERADPERGDRVDALRDEVEAGAYRVDSGAVAEAIVTPKDPAVSPNGRERPAARSRRATR